MQPARLKFSFLAILFLGSLSIAADIPKYGPYAVPLSANTNLDYFKGAHTPDYSALVSFYVHQENDSSCSAAALITVLNGARRDIPMTSKDELVTHRSLTERLTDPKYKASVSGNKIIALKAGTRLGVAVARLAEVLREAAANLKLSHAQVELISIDIKDKDKSKATFHEYLSKNEKTAEDFLIINYTQGVLTGDPEGMVGHIAAIAAYDAKKKLVLILDPDRQWYEPYWSPEDKVFEAISDSRSDTQPGYVYFKYR